MSSATWPDHLLTLDEWDALPEDEFRRAELVKGIIVMAAAAVPPHQWAMLRLAVTLSDQLPDELMAFPDVEVLVDAAYPPTVRQPDVVVAPTASVERESRRFDAVDVMLAVEIVSPSSTRTDRVTKLSEYAEAGIPQYWIVELGPPITLTGFVLVDGEYEENIRTTGKVEVSAPAPLRIDVSTLLDRR